MALPIGYDFTLNIQEFDWFVTRGINQPLKGYSQLYITDSKSSKDVETAVDYCTKIMSFVMSSAPSTLRERHTS
jgi:hypothetical protein